MLQHDGHGLVVHRVALPATGALACSSITPIVVEQAAFQDALDVVGLALGFEVIHHAVHFFITHKSAVNPHRQSRP